VSRASNIVRIDRQPEGVACKFWSPPRFLDPPMPHLPAGSSYQIISWLCLAPAPGKTRHSISELAHQCPAPPLSLEFGLLLSFLRVSRAAHADRQQGVTLRSYLHARVQYKHMELNPDVFSLIPQHQRDDQQRVQRGPSISRLKLEALC
jgi:hypothetical protein